MNKKTFWLVLGIIFTLSLLKITLGARLATYGARLVELKVATQRLADKNQLLTQEIVKRSSLTNIASEAGKLGLTTSGKMVSLTFEVPVALRESRLTR